MRLDRTASAPTSRVGGATDAGRGTGRPVTHLEGTLPNRFVLPSMGPPVDTTQAACPLRQCLGSCCHGVGYLTGPLRGPAGPGCVL